MLSWALPPPFSCLPPLPRVGCFSFSTTACSRTSGCTSWGGFAIVSRNACAVPTRKFKNYQSEIKLNNQKFNSAIVRSTALQSHDRWYSPMRTKPKNMPTKTPKIKNLHSFPGVAAPGAYLLASTIFPDPMPTLRIN